MYLIRFLPNFADLPEFRSSVTARNIRSPAAMKCSAFWSCKGPDRSASSRLREGYYIVNDSGLLLIEPSIAPITFSFVWTVLILCLMYVKIY